MASSAPIATTATMPAGRKWPAARDTVADASSSRQETTPGTATLTIKYVTKMIGKLIASVSGTFRRGRSISPPNATMPLKPLNE